MLSEQDLKYCPKCGNKFTKKESTLLICGHCGFHYYINPRPTNAAIIENEMSEILFIKRKHPPKKGFLDLPGGFVDLEESMEEALVREIHEELGIKLQKYTYFGSYADRYMYKDINFHTLASVYTSTLPSTTKLEAGDDAGSFEWVDKAKIPYEKVAFKSLQKALKEYLT